MPSPTPLEKAAKKVGNTNLLAKKIGRRQSTVREWMQRGWPSPDACVAIEKATDGVVGRYELLDPVIAPASRIFRKPRRAA